MIIAIDGTAASGKGSLAKNLAKELSIYHVDTGIFYRVLANQALKLGIKNNKELINLAKILSVKKIINIRDTEGKNLKSSSISEKSSQIATDKNIRKVLTELQRQYVRQYVISHRGAVIDGRDIGSVVFPDADFKFYLTADLDVRSKRRKIELEKIGEDVTIYEIKSAIQKRDLIDSSRKLSPLMRPKDAIEIDSTNLTIDEQIDKIMNIIKQNK